MAGDSAAAVGPQQGEAHPQGDAAGEVVVYAEEGFAGKSELLPTHTTHTTGGVVRGDAPSVKTASKSVEVVWAPAQEGASPPAAACEPAQPAQPAAPSVDAAAATPSAGACDPPPADQAAKGWRVDDGVPYPFAEFR
eukprot:gene45674-64695_t